VLLFFAGLGGVAVLCAAGAAGAAACVLSAGAVVSVWAERQAALAIHPNARNTPKVVRTFINIAPEPAWRCGRKLPVSENLPIRMAAASGVLERRRTCSSPKEYNRCRNPAMKFTQTKVVNS
jgi:hypothetical protein